MLDPKFEKEVQKKLGELSFSPSEAVWARIDRAVNEKRRRRVPAFWLFLLPSLGLAGAGLFYFSIHQAVPAVKVVRATPGSASWTETTKPAASLPESSSKTGNQSNPETAASPKYSTDPETATNPESATSLKSATSPKSAASPEPAHTPKSSSIVTPGTPPGISDGSQRMPVAALSTASASSRGKSNHQDKTLSSNPTVEPNSANSPERSAGVAGSIPAANQEIATRRTPIYSVPSGLIVVGQQFSAPTAARLPGSYSVAAAKTPINIKPKYSWELGFAGGVGMSSTNSSLFQEPAVAATNGTPGPMYAPTVITASTKKATSAVLPNISYWAGITAQKPLSKAFTLSLGLNFHYYSIRQEIGKAVNISYVSLYQASTLFTAAPAPSQASGGGIYSYYSVGSADVYLNRYYFLELPASILWQVRHSRKWPIFWENGFSLSYMVSSNAVYYNDKSEGFFKDQGTMANKSQLNFATALLVGLPVKGMRLQAGPQLQYGLTTLQHESNIGQHLFYGGLRIVLIPGKKKK
jgi:hypothetical protein